MRIRYHAAGNRWPKRHKFRLPSEWQPGPTERSDLEDFFESLKLELSKIPYRKVKPNYSSNEKNAWEALKGDPEIILKPYRQRERHSSHIKNTLFGRRLPPTWHEGAIHETRLQPLPLTQLTCYTIYNQGQKSLDRLSLFSFIHPFTALTLISCLFSSGIVTPNPCIQMQFPLPTPCFNVALNSGVRASKI